MIFLLFIFSVFSEMSQNFGSSYFAKAKGARSSLSGNEALILNPANSSFIESYSLDLNSYCNDSTCSFGTAINFQDGFLFFLSFDEFMKDLSYDNYSVFAGYSNNLSERFSIGASFGYFNSTSYTSEIKYSLSATFSPWDLTKKYDKWLISFGFLNNFLSSNKDQYFISFSYIQKYYSISFDALSSDMLELGTNNEEVVSISFLPLDYFRLISSIKLIDLNTHDNVAYGAGAELFSDEIKFGFAVLFDASSDKNYYSFNLTFLGE